MVIRREGIIFLAIAILQISFALGAADFDVNSFSCTPSESSLNDAFSCTAQIKNNGDAAGSVSTATLYPDSNNWLEQASYAQSSGGSVSPGQTTEVTFSGLRGNKAGNNGFSRVTLDQVTDTYVADNNIKQNIIDVSVSVSNTASSANMGVSWTSSAEVTAGGNINVVLTWARDSGGCGIGSQSSSKTISGMQNGNKQARTWTVTQGTTAGNCKYTITAAATGANGLASKTDAMTSTITCPNCPVESTSSTAAGTGGGSSGGGGGGTLGELTKQTMKELGKEESFKFTFGGVNHTFMLLDFTATTATFRISSTSQTFTLTVGDEKQVDFELDEKADISVKLKSINTITKKVLFILTPLYIPEIKMGVAEKEEAKVEEKTGVGETFDKAVEALKNLGGNNTVLIIILAVLILIVLVALGYFGWKKRKEEKFRKAIKIAFESKTKRR